MNDVRRIEVGSFIPPEGNRFGGLVISVQIYLIPHPRGLFLFDTGIGEDAEQDFVMRITRTSLPDALATAGVKTGDLLMAANCHLHFDHAGQNFRVPGLPIFAQRTEVALAKEPDYTLPKFVADFDGAMLEEVDGEAEPLPGLRLIPTPGHTAGHQSLIVETNEGRLLLAGQSFNFAQDFSKAAYSVRTATTEEAEPPPWMSEILDLDIQRALFAHDAGEWVEPVPGTST